MPSVKFFWRGASLRPMLPQVYVTWEEGYEIVVELYWLGSFDPYVSESRATVQVRTDLGERFGEWMLPRYERWAQDRTWVS